MRLVFPTDPDRIEHIVTAVRTVVPAAKFDRIEQLNMWPELSVSFHWRDLDTVVTVIKRVLSRSEVRA